MEGKDAALPLEQGYADDVRGQQVAGELDALERKAQRDRKRIEEAGKAKVQALSKDDVAAWRKAMEPVWKKFEGDIGRDLIDAALKSNK